MDGRNLVSLFQSLAEDLPSWTMRIPPETVDAIYAAADIVEVVQDYLPLKKKGTNLWGLSPFKAERTPSFSVSPAKQIFKDFASGKGGNAVTFLMEIEGLSYVEALRHLAQKYGIALPEEDEAYNPAETEDHRASLLALNKWAATWFAQQLETPEGKSIAQSYYKERGFTPPTVQQFMLGYSPEGWTALTDAAQQAQFKLDYLIEAGLTIRNDEGRVFDRFRGRVIFPLQDAMGRVVGFAGRILKSDAKAAKYVNSPESPVYHKSQLLYGLNHGRNAVRNAGQCILVEGYADAISLHQAGVQQTVASSGTSLTAEQAKLIGRYAKEVLIVYDGDTAGINAALRGIDVLLEAGLTPRIAQLPPEHDPDSYVKAYGGTVFLDYLKDKALDFIAFQVQHYAGGAKMPNDPAKQAQILATVAASLARIPDEVTRGLYQSHASRTLGLDEQLVISATNRELLQQQRQVRPGRATNAAPGSMQGGNQPPVLGDDGQPPVFIDGADAPPSNGEVGGVEPTPQQLTGMVPTYAQEREILRLMLNHPDARMTADGTETHLYDWLAAQLEGVEFMYPPFRNIYEDLQDGHRNGRTQSIARMIGSAQPPIPQLITELLTSPYILSSRWVEQGVYVPDPDHNLLAAATAPVEHLLLVHFDQLKTQNLQHIREAQTTGDEATETKLLRRHQKLLDMRRKYSLSRGMVVPTPRTINN